MRFARCIQSLGWRGSSLSFERTESAVRSLSIRSVDWRLRACTDAEQLVGSPTSVECGGSSCEECSAHLHPRPHLLARPRVSIGFQISRSQASSIVARGIRTVRPAQALAVSHQSPRGRPVFAIASSAYRALVDARALFTALMTLSGCPQVFRS